MADTQRTQEELLALYADNNSGQISAQDGRDFVVSSKLRDMADDNILINQDFSIWQEEETFANPASGDYTADGYKTHKVVGGGTSPTINVKKNTSVHEDAFEQTMELEIINVGATGATRHWSKYQIIEDYKKYRGKTVTFLIRLKASTAITFPGVIQISDGIEDSIMAITSLGTNWITYTITRDIDSNATALHCYFILIRNAGEISTTGSIYIQWMKLELGSVATPLIPRRTGEELALCKRYFQKSYAQGIFAGAVTAVGSIYFYINGLTNADYAMFQSVKFNKVMKAAPTITLYDNVGNSGRVTMEAGDNIVGAASLQADSGFAVNATNGRAATEKKLQFHYIAVSRP